MDPAVIALQSLLKPGNFATMMIYLEAMGFLTSNVSASDITDETRAVLETISPVRGKDRWLQTTFCYPRWYAYANHRPDARRES